MTALIAATVATLVLAAIGVVQVLVAAGRPYGRFVWGGQHRVLPRGLRIGSALAVLLYAAIAALLFWRAGAFGAPTTFAIVATWIVFGYFVFGTLLNAISRSRAERAVMTPACAVLSVCTLIVALAPA
ncbi:hypothetical protein [Agromyces sp. LHK192]|uniref:hypothetical protein n=1 Tax=Agromyces sp. LHK192 TaxID=2498704 RepID=UPI000FDBF963|nr:hypothetical protein [Agromyces sp. LHK192]